MTNVTLHLGDCLEYMRTLPAGSVDAVVTDPPYGIGWNCDYSSWIKPSAKMQGGNNRRSYPNLSNDAQQIDPSFLLDFPIVVLWGATYFLKYLGAGSLLVWHKRSSGFLADAEAAWMNKGGGVYVFTEPVEVMQSERVHPTQKPASLMAWCLDRANIPQGATVFDPFMGSGTTGVACVRTGRNFIGCEIDPTYYAIAQRRIAEAQLQPPLFPHEAQPAARQEAML